MTNALDQADAHVLRVETLQTALAEGSIDVEQGERQADALEAEQATIAADQLDAIDARVAALKTRYAAGDVDEDELSESLYDLAVMRTALDPEPEAEAAPQAPPAPAVDRWERVVVAIAAACEAYLNYTPRGE